MGMGVLEIAMAWWAKDPRAHCECTIKGLEHIREALGQGRGVLLCGAHLHAAELAGRFMALEQPVAIVYRTMWWPTRSRIAVGAGTILI
jgi:KDO2-lipid IV(A) lauroyltransferase